MEVYCPKIAKSDMDSGRNHFDQEIAPQKRKSAIYRLIALVLGHQSSFNQGTMVQMKQCRSNLRREGGERDVWPVHLTSMDLKETKKMVETMAKKETKCGFPIEYIYLHG